MNKLLLILLISLQVEAKTIKIAVIDTGYDFKSKWTDAKSKGLAVPKLCKTGHKDFANTYSTIPQDYHGHGTHVAGLIAKYAGKTDYCIIVIRYFDENASANQNLINTIISLKWAIEQDVDIINYSAGGKEPSDLEKEYVELALNKGIKFMAAAGNEATELKPTDKAPCSEYFPACYNVLIERVGNVDLNGVVHRRANYGRPITAYEMGVNVLSLGLNNTYAHMTGTSQATAIHTGKLLNTFKKLDTKVKPK